MRKMAVFQFSFGNDMQNVYGSDMLCNIKFIQNKYICNVHTHRREIEALIKIY